MCVNPTWVDLKGYDHVPDAVLHAMVLVTGDVSSASDGGGGASGGASGFAEEETIFAAKASRRTDDAQYKNRAPPMDSRDAASRAVKTNKLLALKHVIDASRRVLSKDRARKTLIFCRTNFDCENVVAFLGDVAEVEASRDGADALAKKGDWSARSLGGALTNDERRANLQAFKDGECAFLVCTDVAARGIDVREVPFLINATLPETAEEYVHRVGRVGRAGAPGLAVSLVAEPHERVWFCRKKGSKPWLDPSDSDVKEHTVWLDERGALKKIENRLGE